MRPGWGPALGLRGPTPQESSLARILLRAPGLVPTPSPAAMSASCEAFLQVPPSSATPRAIPCRERWSLLSQTLVYFHTPVQVHV